MLSIYTPQPLRHLSLLHSIITKPHHILTTHTHTQVIAFPCNQFGSQEPGAHDEIVHFAAQQYAATFPIMGKVDVNGANAAAVYTMLKVCCVVLHCCCFALYHPFHHAIPNSIT